ncbi:MAG: hypothetical protein EBU01_14655 [Crocinitomicaceae bacterium]|nr:hypothetical protein [Crocinitomicaceae bacterium]
MSYSILNSILNLWSLLSAQPNVVFGTANLFYFSLGLTGYNILTSSPNNWIIDASYKIPCFHEDSLILTWKNHQKTYVPVKYLRRGDLIKTYRHGYVPLYGIGTFQIYHDANDSTHHQLCVCRKELFPGTIQDLLLTSEHSLLVDSLSENLMKNLDYLLCLMKEETFIKNPVIIPFIILH